MTKHRKDTTPEGATDAQVLAAARLFYESQTGSDRLETSVYLSEWMRITRRILDQIKGTE